MKINASKEVIKQLCNQLSKKLQGSQDLTSLVEEYARESFEHDKYINTLVKLYDEEIHRIHCHKDDILSSEQKCC